ncbi:MAG: hypothetical protein AAFQ74_09590 [Cyanobacteria bacterium J06623_4]
MYAFPTHPCYQYDSEYAVAINVFSGELIDAAKDIAAQRIEDPAEQADIFRRLGLFYACVGWESATDFLEQALATAHTVESPETRGNLLVGIADVYSWALTGPSWALHESATRDTILLEAIALAESLPNDSEIKSRIFQNAALQYARTEQLEQARAVINKLPNSTDRQSAHRMLNQYISIFDLGPDSAALSEQTTPLDSEINADAIAVELLPFYYMLLLERAEHSGEPISVSREALDTVTEEYVQSVPLLANPHERGHGYASLGKVFSLVEPNRAIAFLDQAVQALQLAKDTPVPATLPEDYSLRDSLLSIAASFLRIGDAEKALAVISEVEAQNAEDSQDIASQKIFILMNVGRLFFERSQSSQAHTVLQDVEHQLSLNDDASIQNQQRLRLATIYAESGNLEAAEHTVNRIRQNSEAAPFLFDELQSGDFTELLLKIGSYEEALAYARDTNNAGLLTYLPAKLLAAQQNQLALQALNAIESPDQQVQAQARVAAVYATQALPELAIEMMDSALAIAQTGDLSSLIAIEEASLRNPYNSQAYTEAEIQERLAECLASQRTTLVEQAITVFSETANDDTLRKVIQQVDNEKLRTDLALNFLSLDTAMLEIDSISEPALADEYALLLIAKATEAGLFDQAVDIATKIQSDYAQATALLNIAEAFERSPQPVIEP